MLENDVEINKTREIMSLKYGFGTRRVNYCWMCA